MSNPKSNCGTYVDPAREYTCGGSKKKKGGAMDVPFASEHHNFPEAPMVSFPIGKEISTNFVSDNDLYGCKLKGGANKKNQKNQKGGDCGCGTKQMQLGGTQKKKKQKGSGLGYTFDLEHPITNKPEVVRYETVSAYAGVNTVMKGGQNKQKQNGGSAASDALMNYFLDFQHKCRGSEIY